MLEEAEKSRKLSQDVNVLMKEKDRLNMLVAGLET